MKKSQKTNHSAGSKMLTVRCVLLITFLFVPFGQFVSAAHYAGNKEAVQESVKVTGLVKDKSGEPVSGAIILEKGTKNGTATDADGRFSLTVAGPASVLRISFTGYLPVEQMVGSLTTFTIIMEEDEQMLGEVVVIGYGTQRKADVTSSVSSVKKEEFLVGNIQDAAEMIKGKVAGLIVTKGSGDPNSESTIRLRGYTSLLGGNAPLVLVDGIESSMNMVAPESIESIDVLKDASASAIYGTRGAGGVIIVTTKAGKRKDATIVNYSAYATLSDFYKVADFMDPGDVRKGKTTFEDGGYDTDWLSAVSQLGYTQNHNLSIAGGTERSTYSASVSYRKERGTIKKSDNEELKTQFDISHWLLDDKVKVNFNIIKGLHKNSITNASSGGVDNIYRQAVIRNPTEPIYFDGDPANGYYEDFTVFQYYNPVAMINENIGEYKDEWTRLTGNLTIEPVKGWQTNLKLSTNRTNDNSESYTTKKYYTTVTSGTNGYAYKSSGYSELNQLELTTRYEKTIAAKHRVTALAGYDYQYDMWESLSASNFDFPTDGYLYNNISVGAALKDKKAGIGSGKEDALLISFFGRLTYGYEDKYNVLVSVRKEGSSKFGADHKWGLFPAISAGWTISNEDFMDNVSWLSSLKLRMGYGKTGMIASSNYESITRWSYASSSWGYFLDSNGEWKPVLEVLNNPNPLLHWETSQEFNTGADFSFLNDRISGSVDFYNKKTSGLLYYYNVPSPPNIKTTTYANVGEMLNRGFEVMIKATPVQKKDFQYSTTITAAHNANKLMSLSNDLYKTNDYENAGYAGDPVSLPTQRIQVGSSFGKYWTLKTTGVNADGIWMVQNPATGKYETWNAAMSNDDYRQWMGSAIPKIFLAWDNSFRYKEFDLNIQMSSQLGFTIVNEQRMFYENNSIAYNRLESAADMIPIVDENGKPTGESRQLSTAQSQTIVSWYYENGNFVKIDNVTLGYNFNTSAMNNISSFRIYLSGENLLCFTRYKGMDPELTNSDPWALGIDPRDKYPTIRSFCLGLNINFK